jgi:hypothetical protein
LVKKSFLFAVFLLFVTLYGLVSVENLRFGVAQTGTQVSGEINSDTKWVAIKSPYNLTGTVTVNKGVTLTIEAGTTVNTFNHYIQVNGTLKAQGNNVDHVIFISANQHIYPFYSSYPSASIYFSENSSGSIIENALLKSTLITSKSSITLKNNTFNFVYINLVNSSLIDNVITGSVTIEGSSVVTNNTIIGGQDYYSVGVLSNYGSPIISHNVIKSMPFNSIAWGIYFGGTENAMISDNIFSGSFEYCVVVGEVSYGANLIERNLMTNNLSNLPNGEDSVGVGIGIGIEIIGANITGSTLIIWNNTITGNSVGINIHAPTLDDVNTIIQPTILGNNIFNNSRNSLFLGLPLNPPDGRSLKAGGDVNASSNWWGTTDIQAINQTIYDFKNKTDLGTVNFIPFLTSPNPQATPNTFVPTTPIPTQSQSPEPILTPSPSMPFSTKTMSLIIVGVVAVIVALVVLLLVYGKKARRGD